MGLLLEAHDNFEHRRSFRVIEQWFHEVKATFTVELEGKLSLEREQILASRARSIDAVRKGSQLWAGLSKLMTLRC